MIRRALIGAALVAVMFAASGASGQVFGGTAVVKKIAMDMKFIDTANYLDGAAALVNDSLIFYSQTFGVSKDWTRCVARLLVVSGDTVFAADTIGFAIQSKMDTPYDSTWWTLATMTKKSEATIHSAPGTSTIRAYSDADTVGVADLYRIKLAIMAAQDSTRKHDQTGILPLNAKYLIYLLFNLRGNE